MKIVFFMAHAGYTRNFESTLKLLAEQGHTVTLVFDKQKENAGGADDIVVSLERAYPSSVKSVQAPDRPKGDPQLLVGQQLRVVLDWMRYLAPEFRDADKLRERAGTRVPPSVRSTLSLPVVRSRPVRAVVSAFLRGAERSVPPRPEVVEFIDKLDPDLVLVTPLLEVGSPQTEYFRAARAAGRRTGLCVASWDNLTTAGLIHEKPDFLTVWNEPQRVEADEMHGISPNSVVVTGACAYDHWFDWEPSTTRDEFCARVGIRPDLPYVLYLCSSGFITPDEGDFAVRWIERMRNSLPPELRETGVVVRPHPTNPIAGKDGKGDAVARLGKLANVAVWPSSAMNPTNRAAREIYFDSIYHSAAVLGVNTSGQIESAIVGRRVLTVYAPEYKGTQEGTLHYHHLLSVNGGLLDHAESWDEHAAQLAAALGQDADASEKARAFLEGFVRPFGLDQSATPLMVDAFEAAAARPAPAPAGRPAYAPLFRPFIALSMAGVSRFSERAKKAKPKAAPPAAKTVVTRGRARWNPLTWLLGLGRAILAGLLAVPVMRQFLYRHVRPALLSTVVLIERAARPGGQSGALAGALGSGPRALEKPKAKAKPKAKSKAAPAPATAKATSPKRLPAPVAKVVKAPAADWNRQVTSLVRGSSPVVAGPWLGGVATETAVWIPFLRYLTKQWPGLSDRLVAVSRGGVAPWYADVAHRYVDISELYNVPSRLVLANAESLVDSVPDSAVVTATASGAKALLGQEIALLDPQEVIAALLASKDKDAPFRYAPLAAPAERPAWAPERYAAASFATSSALPDTPANRRAALLAVERAATTAPVVLLADDYGIASALGDRVVVPPSGLTLSDKAAVLAHAESVVGVLDGLVAAAAAQGKHVVSLCADPAAADERRIAAVRAAAAGAGGQLAVLQAADAEALFASPLLSAAPEKPAAAPRTRVTVAR